MKSGTLAILVGNSVAVAICVLVLIKTLSIQQKLPGYEECSMKICKEDIRIITQEFSINPAGLIERNISCNNDEVIISCGYKLNDDKNLFIWRNSPSENGKDWKFSLSNYGQSSCTIKLYTICLKTQ